MWWGQLCLLDWPPHLIQTIKISLLSGFLTFPCSQVSIRFTWISVVITSDNLCYWQVVWSASHATDNIILSTTDKALCANIHTLHVIFFQGFSVSLYNDKSIGLWRRYIDITTTILDTIQHPVGKEQRSCNLNQIAHTGNTRKQPTWFWLIIWSVIPAWTSLPSGLVS
jgi:hypothetical protein